MGRRKEERDGGRVVEEKGGREGRKVRERRKERRRRKRMGGHAIAQYVDNGNNFRPPCMYPHI